MLLVAFDGRIEDANTAAAQMFGWSCEELRERSLFDLVDASRETLDDYLRSCARTGSSLPAAFDVRTADAAPVRLTCNASAIRIGSTRRILLRWASNESAHAGFIELNDKVAALRREVRHRRRTEVSLRNSEARLRAILETAAEGIITFLDDGTVESFNRAAERITGFEAAEIIGTNVGELLPPEISEGGQSSILQYLGYRPDASDGSDPHESPAREVLVRSLDRALLPVEFSLAGIDLEGSHLFVGVLRDIRDRKRLEERLLHQANHDHLTGIPNRILLEDRLTQAILSASRREEVLALLFIDLDRFKWINDSLGHEVGDEVLCEFAKRLENERRGNDTLARIGGDEFVWVVTGIESESDALVPACRVLEQARRPFHIGDREFVMSASVGISMFPRDGDNAQMLLGQSDAAMYAAKASGKNTYRAFSSEMSEQASRRLEMEARLRKAIEQGEFRLHFQPQVSLASGVICGVEALVRWEDPEFGLVQPLDFIPLAEETGLIVQLGSWVVEEACRQAVRWRDEGIANLRMAVNVSPRQFEQDDLVENIAGVLERTGLAPELLDLELTEGSVMADVETNTQKLEELKRLGVTISIDDFGTGYSSLAYLQRFPIDTIKIDQSFVRNLESNAGDLAMVRAIVGLAHNLGLRVVAEGVETEAQLALLKTEDCDEAQGYFFSRPLPALEIYTDLLRHTSED